MLWLEVAWTLCRELLRALLVPLRVLLYLPARHRWRALAREVLGGVAAHPETDADEFMAAFLRQVRPMQGPRPHVFVSAGEASGEAHGVRLMRALADEDLRWSAFGGHLLQQAGAELLMPLSEHAVMGFFSVLRQLPLILRSHARFLRLLREDPPDLLVLIDYPGLHLVMARAARRRSVPLLHYIAPQYWAWGPWRMRRYRRSIAATLTILPFETAFFRRFGVPARYVGHPLLDQLAREPADPVEVASIAAQPTLCLLPGSRSAEIRANLPGLLRTAALLRQEHPDLRVVVAHTNQRRAALIEQLLTADGGAATLVIGALAPQLAGARLVLAKSGTGSLEACLHGTPTVVVYHLRSLLGSLGYHNILSVPWIAAANLIAGRRVVPEFCFHGSQGWDEVAAAARALWRDGPERDQCLLGLDEVRRRLGRPGASDRVAGIVRAFLQRCGT